MNRHPSWPGCQTCPERSPPISTRMQRSFLRQVHRFHYRHSFNRRVMGMGSEKERISMASFANAPSLADEKDAFKGAYAARVQNFTEAGRGAGLTPTESDDERVA